MFDVQLSAYISLHRVTSSTPKFVSASFLKHLPVVELHLGSFEAITLIFLFVELTSNQRIRLEKPSTAPWTKKPKGANLPIRQRAIRSLARRWHIFVSLAYVFDDVPLLQGLKSEVWSLKSKVQSPFSAFIFLNLTSTSSRQQPQKASLKHWKIGLKWPEANKQGD